MFCSNCDHNLGPAPEKGRSLNTRVISQAIFLQVALDDAKNRLEVVAREKESLENQLKNHTEELNNLISKGFQCCQDEKRALHAENEKLRSMVRRLVIEILEDTECENPDCPICLLAAEAKNLVENK